MFGSAAAAGFLQPCPCARQQVTGKIMACESELEVLALLDFFFGQTQQLSPPNQGVGDNSCAKLMRPADKRRRGPFNIITYPAATESSYSKDHQTETSRVHLAPIRLGASTLNRNAKPVGLICISHRSWHQHPADTDLYPYQEGFVPVFLCILARPQVKWERGIGQYVAPDIARHKGCESIQNYESRDDSAAGREESAGNGDEDNHQDE